MLLNTTVLITVGIIIKTVLHKHSLKCFSNCRKYSVQIRYRQNSLWNDKYKHYTHEWPQQFDNQDRTHDNESEINGKPENWAVSVKARSPLDIYGIHQTRREFDGFNWWCIWQLWKYTLFINVHSKQTASGFWLLGLHFGVTPVKLRPKRRISEN